MRWIWYACSALWAIRGGMVLVAQFSSPTLSETAIGFVELIGSVLLVRAPALGIVVLLPAFWIDGLTSFIHLSVDYSKPRLYDVGAFTGIAATALSLMALVTHVSLKVRKRFSRKPEQPIT